MNDVHQNALWTTALYKSEKGKILYQVLSTWGTELGLDFYDPLLIFIRNVRKKNNIKKWENVIGDENANFVNVEIIQVKL